MNMSPPLLPQQVRHHCMRRRLKLLSVPAELDRVQHSDEYLAWTAAQAQLPKSQRARRKIAQALTKEFNQLSGTMSSVRARVAQLSATLAQLGDGPARVMFCIGLVQTAKNNAVEMMVGSPRFGFPVAMVLTSMFAEAAELPRLFHGTLKSLKEGSPLCVPQYTGAAAGGGALEGDAWKRANGYRCVRHRGPIGVCAPSVHAAFAFGHTTYVQGAREAARRTQRTEPRDRVRVYAGRRLQRRARR